MLEPSDLLEIHRRTHEGAITLLEHCARLSAEELCRELPGFGYPSVRKQLHHISEAEDYWIAVLRGEYAADGARAAHLSDHDYEAEVSKYPTVEALEGLRATVAAATQAYLAGTSAPQLAAPGEYCVWGGELVTLIPALVVLRPITHAFHHRGQVAAMCRLLGSPAPPSRALDFPLRPCNSALR
jgi:uncharacterized damage-inducible protein DinB